MSLVYPDSFRAACTYVVPQSKLPIKSPCLSSPLCNENCPSRLTSRLRVCSLPNGKTGEPARERILGVLGPEYSAFVMGRGPPANEFRRDSDIKSGRMG